MENPSSKIAGRWLTPSFSAFEPAISFTSSRLCRASNMPLVRHGRPVRPLAADIATAGADHATTQRSQGKVIGELIAVQRRVVMASTLRHNRQADHGSHGRGYAPSSPAGMSRPCGPCAPILFGFPLHRRCVRVLALDPMRRPTRTIEGIAPLRHDALKPELTGVREHERAIRVIHVLVEA